MNAAFVHRANVGFMAAFLPLADQRRRSAMGRLAGAPEVPPRVDMRPLEFGRWRRNLPKSVFLHGAEMRRSRSQSEGRLCETLVDVAAVGICGSDLHYYKG